MTLRPRVIRWLAPALLAAVVVALPAAGAPKGRAIAATGLLAHVSQSVAFRYWLAHPDEAPVQMRAGLDALQGTARRGRAVARGAQDGDRFNLDNVGLPQNEESVTVCRSRPRVVLMGTNDFRGFFTLEGNGTGWHLSLNNGRTVANEGFLPAVEVLGTERASSGDPVMVADSDCKLYGGGLAVNPEDPFGSTNGIEIARTTPQTLASCPGGSDPSCWPIRKAVATASPPHFLDKPWFDVGKSAGEQVVWAAFSDFLNDPEAPLGFVSASIKAVRCDAELTSCTDPILISGTDKDVQFADVTIGPDGRTYITWSEIRGELEQTPQTFVHKLRIAEPGSTTFGPTQVIFEEDLAIPFGGFLHSNDFRVATYPKSEVALVRGDPRVFVVWDRCRFRLLDNLCEEAEIVLSHSDDDGASWTRPATISRGGDNYFPAIGSTDQNRSKLAFAWFTNRLDGTFHNRQHVELFSSTAAKPTKALKRALVTRAENESEADPVLGGFFIGDYIEVFADRGSAYVAYNANYRKIRVLGEGFAVAQQDNYLRKLSLD
jgi:hypothetical protein